jgi:hypothetical protein
MAGQLLIIKKQVNMKAKAIFIMCILGLLLPIAKAQTIESALIGNWYSEDLSKSTISIYQDKTGAYFGKIIKSADNKYVGKIPLLNFKRDGDKFTGKIKPATLPFELDGEITFLNIRTIQLKGHRLFITKGKLNFYLSVVDDKLRTEHDQPSIGLLVCQEKDKVVAEYALKDVNKPIGVTQDQLTEAIPANLKGSLPTIEQLE